MDQQRVNKKSQSSDQQSLKRSEKSSSLVVGRAKDQEEVVADEMAGKALKDWVSAVPAQPVDVSRNFTDSSEAVRRSLTVGRAADSEELIADEMADRALSQLRRKESHSSADANDPLGGTQVDSGTERQISALRGKGSSLRERELQGFSDAYGVDLSATRVHQSSKADELSRNLQADAFTVGNDVFFRKGLYNPGTTSGDRLLGHELAHVAIQSGGGLSRMASGVGLPSRELQESKSESNASDLLANRQMSTQPMKQIRRDRSAEQAVDSAEPQAEGPALPKRQRRNAISMRLPELISLEDFTKAAKANWSRHLFTNATDVLKEKLTAYHGSELAPDARYRIVHEIEEICDAYLVKRTVELGKKAGADEGETLNQRGKDDKIAAIGELGKQAKSIKKAIERSGLLAGSLEDLQAEGSKDKRVKKMKAKYTPQTAGVFFNGLGLLINKMASDPGSYKEAEIKVMFPVVPGAVWAGFEIGIKADQDFNQGKGGAIHADLEIKGRLEAGLDLGVIKLESGINVGFFLDAKAPDAAQLGRWLSMGAYDNFRNILPESTVNTMWFGSNATDFNKAKADQWMAAIDEALNTYPEARHEKYKDNKKLLDADRELWAQQAQDTYVRAGLVGGVDGSVQAKNLQGKIAASVNAAAKARAGTEITAKTLHDYADSDSHDRSFSQGFRSWEAGYDVVWDGWKGAYKLGQEYHGEKVTDVFEGEFKTGLPWPASSITSWLAAFMREYQRNETKENKKKQFGKDTVLGLVFSGPNFYDIATQADKVQKESWVSRNIQDEAGFGDKGSGLVLKIKMEEPHGGKCKVTLIAGTQLDLDREYGDKGPVKVGGKLKAGQTFIDRTWFVPGHEEAMRG